MMVYDVLVTRTADEQFTARALLLPDIVVSGADEDEVLEQLRGKLVEVQANSRTVRLEVPSVLEPALDPWLRFAGVWAHEPEWEAFQSEIEEYRQSIDSLTESNS